MKIEGVEIPTQSSFKIPACVWAACLACIAIGVGAFALGFAASPRETWLWLVVDFVIFFGLANGVLLWAAVFRMTQTRWTGAINRLGHSVLPFAGLLFFVLIALLYGVRNYAVWLDHPIPEKAAWLNVPFMAVRDIVCFAVLWAACLLLVRWSLAVDAGVSRGEGVSGKQHYRLTAMATAAVLCYVLAGTIVSYDFIMSLSPEWASTMFAPYFWITSLYAGMAVLIIVSAVLRKALSVERFLQTQQFHDMGNLLLGFSLFSMGLFFAQYLTIWYENLPEEAHFILLRYGTGIWQVSGWGALIVGYAIPFVLLQSVRLKKNPVLSSLAAVLVIVGVGWERYVLVVPSVEPDKLMIYPVAILGILAFVGAFVLGICVFLSRYQPVSAAEVALRQSDMKLEVLD